MGKHNNSKLFLQLLVAILIVMCHSTYAKVPVFGEGSGVIMLTEENFRAETQRFSDGRDWVILFYASWCPHCQDIQKIYDDAVALHSKQYTFAAINCEKNLNLKELFQVSTFPSIFVVSKETQKAHRFRGIRTSDTVSDFVKGGYKELPGIEIPDKKEFVDHAQDFLVSLKATITSPVGALVLIVAVAWLASLVLVNKKSEENEPILHQNVDFTIDSNSTNSTTTPSTETSTKNKKKDESDQQLAQKESKKSQEQESKSQSKSTDTKKKNKEKKNQ